MASYTKSSQQTVHIKTDISELQSVTAGVPNGSVGGPLLNICIKNIANIIPGSTCAICVDDSSLVFTSHLFLKRTQMATHLSIHTIGAT